MNDRIFRRILALLFALLLSIQPWMVSLAEDVETPDQTVDEVTIEQPDDVVQEADAFTYFAPDDVVDADEGCILQQPEIAEGTSDVGDTDVNTVPENGTPTGNTDPPTADPPTADPPTVDPPGDPSGEPPGEEDPDAVEGYATRRFTETVSAAGETWTDVNLVRGSGFDGKLALVSGCLTLNNVLIEGVPAKDVNLLGYFNLAPGASIACSSTAPLSINMSALSINKGSSKTLRLSWYGSALQGKKARWTTSSKSLVKVKNGKITARKKGTAFITAKFKGQKVICRLDITGIIYAKSVKLKKSMTLALFNGTTLRATVLPKNTWDKSVTWSSSNPSVASVDENGLVAGLAPGTANIYARTINGKTAKCKVTVKAVMPKSVDFRNLYVTIRLDENGQAEPFQTTAVISPGNTSYPEITYASSDPSVASVDELGVVTPLACGTATITAYAAAKTNVRNTCKVCIIEHDAPRLEGLVIGLNPGHQVRTIKKRYPLAPGSKKRGLGVKTGASGRATRQHEYEVVLQVGLKLKRILEEQGATVYITRTTNDVMLTNIDRAKMLNAKGVDVALQLHCNSCTASGKNGSSCYIRTTCDWVAESRSLATIIAKTMSQNTGFKNLGVKIQNNYMSLNWTTTPSVLLEMGYLSNRSDDRKLAKDSFREQLAYGIYLGLCQYFGR